MKTCPNCYLRQKHGEDVCVKRLKEMNERQAAKIHGLESGAAGARLMYSDMKYDIFRALFCGGELADLAKHFVGDIRDD